MTDEIDILCKSFEQDIKNTSSLLNLEEVRVRLLGKSGSITQLLKSLKTLTLEEKKIKGVEYNNIRIKILDLIADKQECLKYIALKENLANDIVDATLPIRDFNKFGGVHPISQSFYDMINILNDMGFSIVLGPEIEDEYYNFSALNIPDFHPARQDHDTFYLNKTGYLLRTQTSNAQIRTLKNVDLPIKIISPGKVFRSDSDATHVPNFHQIEGLYIGKSVHMGHLKSCLINFCKKFFCTNDIITRLRPSYFPFTEPGAEMDIKYSSTNEPSKNWLEVLGCGMVHPNVLRETGVDPNKFQGFAFGLGVERFAMLKYNISDLRDMYKGDLEWLKHFNFAPTKSL